MLDPSKLLSALPATLREPLLQTYREITSNYLERRWEPSELNGGKFCEVVYTIINGALAGKFAAKPSKPANMLSACRALENLPPDPSRSGDRSLRILIPRVLPVLYEIRNNRGVGHVGGDVDPNYLDATAVHSMASWVLAELVRIFHDVSTKEAQEAVDTLVERKLSLIWEIGNVKRVLDTSISKSDQSLLLLHQKIGWVADEDLASWVEYSSVSMFRKRILESLHKAKLIEYDRAQSRVHISPRGSADVETRIIKPRSA